MHYTWFKVHLAFELSRGHESPDGKPALQMSAKAPVQAAGVLFCPACQTLLVISPDGKIPCEYCNAVFDMKGELGQGRTFSLRWMASTEAALPIPVRVSRNATRGLLACLLASAGRIILPTPS